MEIKIHSPARSNINILNEKEFNTSCFNNSSPKLSLKPENSILNYNVGFMTMMSLISSRLVKRVASLNVNELQGLEVDQKGFILAYVALTY